MFLSRVRSGLVSLVSSPFQQQSVRTFRDNTKFRPAVNALQRQRENLTTPFTPLEKPSSAAPREGPGALTQGFGGARPSGGGRFGQNSRNAGPKRTAMTSRSKDLVKETTLSESTGIFTRVISIGRVSRMTGQGRKMQFRALVVMGNGKGAAGFGVGKGLNPRSALVSAVREGEKDLVFVDVAPWGGLYHDVEGHCNNTKVVIKAIDSNKWYATAGRLMRCIMECTGITSYSCVIIGRRNPFSIVNAAFDALGQHKTPKEIAKKRGRKLIDKSNPDYFEKETVH